MGRKSKKNKLGLCNMIPKHKYDVMDNMIEDIYTKYVRLEEQETQLLKARFKMVMESFIEVMRKEDPVFNLIFNRIVYTGSFFEGLRITEATEYDLNLVLKPKLIMKTITKKRAPGFASVRIVGGSHLVALSTLLHRNNFNEPYYLDPMAVRSWMQGVVTRALQYLESNGDIPDFELKICQSGPAWTLSVTSSAPPCKTIDIDLMPVLEFSTQRINPATLNKNDIRKKGLDEPWFLVPKPPTHECRYKSTSWRMSFPIQESAIVCDLKFFKYTLRMLKKVRDQLEIDEVASYYIKTVFLWDLQRYGPEKWITNRKGFLFMQMLYCLRSALEIGEIRYLWNPLCNLIGNVNRKYLINSAGKLRNFCSRIDRLVDDGNHKELKSLLNSLLDS